MVTLYENPNFDGSILTFDPKNVKYIYKLFMNRKSDSPFTLTDKPIDGLNINNIDFFDLKSVKNETDDFFLVVKEYLSDEIVTIQESINDTSLDTFAGYIEIFKKKKNALSK